MAMTTPPLFIEAMSGVVIGDVLGEYFGYVGRGRLNQASLAMSTNMKESPALFFYSIVNLILFYSLCFHAAHKSTLSPMHLMKALIITY